MVLHARKSAQFGVADVTIRRSAEALTAEALKDSAVEGWLFFGWAPAPGV